MVTGPTTGHSSGDEVWALIPARSGSKSVKDKNLQEVAGHSLLAWSVIAATACNAITRVFVSTDSPNYADEALLYGAEIPFLRPNALATDFTSDYEVIHHFLKFFRAQGSLPSILVHLRPTTPMRDPAVIDSAIQLARDFMGSVSAIRSVHEAPESPFKWFYKDQAGFLTTLGGDRTIDGANARRQSFPAVYVPNGYVDILYPHLILDTQLLHGDSVRPFETKPVIEVDTQSDLELLRVLWGVPDRLES